MVKKGLLGAALGTGALFLVFGTSAPSYVKTAFHRVRQNAKDAVDPQFEIERARGDIDGLKPSIEKNIEILARAEVDAEHLDREIAAIQVNLNQEKNTLVSLKDSLKTGEFRWLVMSPTPPTRSRPSWPTAMTITNTLLRSSPKSKLFSRRSGRPSRPPTSSSKT